MRLLGGAESAPQKLLDLFSAGGLLVASAHNPALLALFDARTEGVRVAGELLRRLDRRLRTVSRYERSELLVAAHSVLVVTAYFESLEQVEDQFGSLDLRPGDWQVIALKRGRPEADDADFVSTLLTSDIPMPLPHVSREQAANNILSYYRLASEHFARFVQGLALWDRLNDTEREFLVQALRKELPQRALARYESRFLGLAAECPELFLWANMYEHSATREVVRRATKSIRDQIEELTAAVGDTRVGLGGLSIILEGISKRAQPSRVAHRLREYHRAELESPLVETSNESGDIRAPRIREGYINPAFQVAEATREARPGEEVWWEEFVIREDLQGFLAGYLTSLTAADTPLVVLGHPGSGKSLLAKVLAAALPSTDFTVVRVELRDVPADATIQSQIEAALSKATHGAITWATLVEEADGTVLVVLLDGFDELLQSAGVSRSDYLEQVREFQRIEAAYGRRVAAVVTSRTIVADRVRLPIGTLLVKLEPFSPPEIRQWLFAWNTCNRSYFAETGVRPLDVDALVPHLELARQPLLLLLLAIYDADGNALQKAHDRDLQQADLYERLLRRFVQREAAKGHPHIEDYELAELAEDELDRLSLIAFGMFNRGSQVVSDIDLDDDMKALLPEDRRRLPNAARLPSPQSGFRRPLSPAKLILGRFFFVHESQATIGADNERLHTYEFLHATFGEFLVARLTVKILKELAETSKANRSRVRLGAPAAQRLDDDLLAALLAFAPLTSRVQIVTFLRQLVGSRKPAQAVLIPLVETLFRRAHADQPSRRFGDYHPIPADPVTRESNYTLNLLVIALALQEEGTVQVSALFGQDEPSEEVWRRASRLWRACLEPNAWESVFSTLGVRIIQRDGQRDVVLTLDPLDAGRYGLGFAPPPWQRHVLSEDKDASAQFTAVRRSPALLPRVVLDARLTLDSNTEMLLRAFEPLLEMMPESFDVVLAAEGCTPVSAAHALIQLHFGNRDVGDSNMERELLYGLCLKAAQVLPASAKAAYLAQVMRQMRQEAPTLPPRLVVDVTAQTLNSINEPETDLATVTMVAECAAEQLGRSDAIDRPFLEILERALALVSPVALMANDPALCLRLLILADRSGPYQTGVLPALIQDQEYLLEQINLVELSYRSPQVVIDCIGVVRRQGLRNWANRQAATVLDAMSSATLARIRPEDLDFVLSAISTHPAGASRAQRIERRWREARKPMPLENSAQPV